MKQMRRKRKRWQREPPLPVPIASLTADPVGPRSWFYYSGVLQGASVVVSHSGDISFLYSMGFFGKGSLSRTRPDFCDRSFTATVERPADRRLLTAKVISRRSYVRHLKNSKPYLEDLAELCDCDWDKNDDDVEDFHPWQPWAAPPSAREAAATVAESTEAQDEEDSMDSAMVEKQNLQYAVPQQVFSRSGGAVSDLWSTTKNSWDDNTAGDADFWGTVDAKDCVTKNQPDSSGKDDQEKQLQVSKACGGTVGENSRSSACDDLNHVQSEQKNSSNADVCLQSQNNGPSEKVEGEVVIADEDVEAAREAVCDNGAEQTCTSHKHSTDPCGLAKCQMEVDSVTDHSATDESGVLDFASSSHSTHPSLVAKVLHGASGVPEDNAHSHSESAVVPHRPDVVSQAKTASASSSKADGLPHLRCLYACADVDPLCLSEEEDGDVLVVADSDDEVQECKQCSRHADRWLPVLKRDPWPSSEQLCLALEEAFFLSYGLGCLSVTREGESQEAALGLEALWRECCRLQDGFAARYTVYQHLRSKGWVPKAGLKFACDFVLYEEGPLQTHSSYCVLVRQVREDRLDVEVDAITDLQCLDPVLLSGANRMTNTVSKELLFCHVVVPAGMEEEMLLSPKCISQLSVMETALTRWVPSQERVRCSN